MTTKLRCTFETCNCSIIPFNETKLVKLPPTTCTEAKLLLPNKDHSSTGDFLEIHDVWDFDNIGVSKDVPHDVALDIPFNDGKITKLVKYLICSDCERGPIGFLGTVAGPVSESNVYFLSIDSVKRP